MQIDKYKVTLNRFTSEIDEELDRGKYMLITTEAQITDVSTPDNGDGTFNKVYKAKVCGRTIIKQSEEKIPLVAKSKHSRSQALKRLILRDAPDEQYYENCMNALIANWEDVLDFMIKEHMITL